MYQPKPPYQKNDVFICRTNTGDLIDKVILEVSQTTKMLKISTVRNWLRCGDFYYEWISFNDFNQMIKAKIGVAKELGFWIFKYKTVVCE